MEANFFFDYCGKKKEEDFLIFTRNNGMNKHNQCNDCTRKFKQKEQELRREYILYKEANLQNLRR